MDNLGGETVVLIPPFGLQEERSIYRKLYSNSVSHVLYRLKSDESHRIHSPVLKIEAARRRWTKLLPSGHIFSWKVRENFRLTKSFELKCQFSGPIPELRALA